MCVSRLSTARVTRGSSLSRQIPMVSSSNRGENLQEAADKISQRMFYRKSAKKQLEAGNTILVILGSNVGGALVSSIIAKGQKAAGEFLFASFEQLLMCLTN